MPFTLAYVTKIAPKARKKPQIARDLRKFLDWEPFPLQYKHLTTTPPIVLEVDGTRLPPLPVEDVLRDHVKPGRLLTLKDSCFGVKKYELWKILRDKYDADPSPLVYTLQSLEGNLSGPRVQKGEVRQTHWAITAKTSFARQMGIPYRSLSTFGHAEVTLHHYNGKSGACPREHDIRGWQWLLWRFPHLRPDVIVKSMPEDSYIYIDPWTNGNKLGWLFARLTKKEVASIENGSTDLASFQRNKTMADMMRRVMRANGKLGSEQKE